jgi:HNH endonuclease
MNTAKRRKMKTVFIKLPCGKITEIDEVDLYLKDIFPFWRTNRKKWVVITRYIKTEYGAVRQDVYLARAIAKPPHPFVVDHKDRDPLNNKRSNLRLASPQQNAKNKTKDKNKTSKYYGVSLCRSAKSNPWRVFLRDPNDPLRKKRISRSFSTEIEAAKGYDQIAKELWGEFAPLNFPNE